LCWCSFAGYPRAGAENTGNKKSPHAAIFFIRPEKGKEGKLAKGQNVKLITEKCEKINVKSAVLQNVTFRQDFSCNFLIICYNSICKGNTPWGVSVAGKPQQKE